MEKFKKLNRNEMRNVNGGNVQPTCFLACKEDFTGRIGYSYVADCSPDHGETACFF